METNIKLQGIWWDCKNPHNKEIDFRPKFIPFYGLHVKISAAYFFRKGTIK
jgi:hypothetical protein